MLLDPGLLGLNQRRTLRFSLATWRFPFLGSSSPALRLPLVPTVLVLGPPPKTEVDGFRRLQISVPVLDFCAQRLSLAPLTAFNIPSFSLHFLPTDNSLDPEVPC